MTSVQAGQRAPPISAKVKMASATFIKATAGCTHILCIVLVGLLLPSVLVSGQDSNSTTSMSSTNSTMSYGGMNGTTMTYSTSMSMIYCPSFTCNYTECYTMYSSQNATECAAGVCWCQLIRQSAMYYNVGCSASCADSCVNASQTNCSVDCCNSTGCLNSSFASMMMTTATASTSTTATSSPTTSSPGSTTSMTSTTTPSSNSSATTQSGSTMNPSSSAMTQSGSTMSQSSSATTQSGSTMNQSSSATTQSGSTMNQSSSATTQSAAAMTPSGTSMTSYSSSMSSMMSTWSPSSNSTGMNGTTMTYSTSMSMIYCPSFTCNYTDCYTMYTSQNATECAAGVCWCQLIRQSAMCYTVGCSVSCADSCVNASHTNCSVDCCNSTGCLNSSFASMMMTTTTVAPTTVTTSTPATVPTTTPSTTANNGNKCHTGICTGAECYTDFINNALQTCSSSQPHCQLKKENKESSLQWTAGCTTNCSDKATCKANTEPPCHLECCNATLTSCLWLNGTLNVPSMAARGPHLHTELIASLICLLAIAFLL